MAATLQEVLISFEARIGDAEKNISKITNGLEKTGKKAKEQSSKFKDAGKSVNAFYAKLLAGAAAFRAMYNATRDNIQATAKLNAVIKATGGAAGVTRGNVKGIVKEIQNYSGATEATVKNSAAMLLTFTNINKKVFPDTLKLASDMSAAFGQDMKSSVIQLGKALNDPAIGYTALKEVGISFSAEQAKQIKYFSATNQLAKAQGVILSELQREFGGTAAAMKNTPIGQIETAMSQLKDALAEVGKIIFPVFAKIASVIGDFVTWLTSAGPVVKGFAAAVAVAVSTLLGPVGMVVGLLTAIGLLNSMQKSLDDVAGEVKKTDSAIKDLSKQKPLLASLKNMKRGTKAYEDTVKSLIALNPELAKTGASVKDSYDDITLAVNKSGKEQEKYIKAISKVQAEETQGIIRRLGVSTFFSETKISEVVSKLTQSYKLLGKTSQRAGSDLNETFNNNLIAIENITNGMPGLKARLRAAFDSGAAAAKRLRSEMGNVNRTASKTPTVGDSSGKAKSFYDIQKARTDFIIMQAKDAEKAKLQASSEYYKEVDKISKAMFKTEAERTEALYIARNKMDFKIKKAEEEQAKAAAAKRNKEISEAADVAESALSLAGQAASGDMLGALSSGLQQFGGPWGKWAAVGISALQGLMSIFKKNTESEIDRIKREFEKIRDTYGQASGVQESLADFLGEATASGLDSSLRSLMLRVKEIGGILGISLDDALSIDFLSGFGDNLASLIADTEAELSDIANGVSGMTAASEEEALALIEEYPQFAEQIQDSIRAAKQGSGPFSFGFLGQLRFELIEYNKLLNAQKEIYSEILDITGDIQDKEAQRAILKAQADLKDIQDDIRTGRREEADTLAEQIALYDDMISALDGVSGAQDLINDLLEQRLALQQKLNGETDISAYQAGAQGASLSSLVAELDKLNRDIETGAVREGTAETVQRQVGLIDAIIANLQGQGASAEVIQGFATQKADILKGFYGEQGFAARAGSGAAVGFSAPASSTVTSNNTTTNNNVNISGQQFNDDFFSWMADEFSRRYGVNILAGA